MASHRQKYYLKYYDAYIPSQQLKNVILELQVIYQGYVATAAAKVMKLLLEISYKEHCL